MDVKRLGLADIAELYRVITAYELFARDLFPTETHFRAGLSGIEGFSLRQVGQLVGAITYTNFAPLMDAALNVVVAPEYRGRWLRREVLHQIFSFPFDELNLPRLSSYCIKGVTPWAETALLKAGFRLEGVRERAILLPDGYHDLVLYGMLRERCRWI